MSAAKNRIIYIALSVVILLLVASNIYQYLDKQKYIHYMSENITFDFGNMNSNIIRTNIVLEDVLSDKEIAIEDLTYLRDAAFLIAEQLQDYQQIAVHDLRRVTSDELSNASGNTASDIADYFARMYMNHDPNKESIELNESQLKKIYTIKQINDMWREEVEVHAAVTNPSEPVKETLLLFLDREFHDIYEENAITQEHWVHLLINLSNRTEAFLEENYPDVDHGFRKYLYTN